MPGAGDASDLGFDAGHDAVGFDFDAAALDVGASGCDDACPTGQFCFGTRESLQRLPPTPSDGGEEAGADAATGPALGFACRDVPDACALTAVCSCLTDAGVAADCPTGTGPVCRDSDAGSSTFTCLIGGK